MAKYLVVQMPDGSEWEVPVQLIAEDRAVRRAQRDLERDGTPYQETYDEELDYGLSDTDELHDWAKNNMRWSDVQETAVRIKEAPPVDYDEGWCNGDNYFYDKTA